MEETEIRRIVAETVAETLIKLGIDTKDPLALQADMQMVRRQRLAQEKLKGHALTTAIGLATVGFITWVWTSFWKGV